MRKRRAFDSAASEFRVRRLALDLAAEEVAREMQITTSKYFRLEKCPLRARHGLVLELDETLKRIEQRTASASRA